MGRSFFPPFFFITSPLPCLTHFEILPQVPAGSVINHRGVGGTGRGAVGGILKNLWLAGMAAGAQGFSGGGDKEPPFGAQGGVLWEADYRHQ